MKKTFVKMIGAVTLAALWIASTKTFAASITWGTPVTISGDTDVSTTGALIYAYDESNTGTNVNGVPFTGANSTTSLGGGNVTMSGFTGGADSGSYINGGTGSPVNTLSGSYQTVLKGGAWTSAATAATVTLNNLIAGHTYLVQIWVMDARTAGSGRTETVTSTGGNTVTLDYNSTDAAGGVGQYTIGTFTASATAQTFTLTGSASSQLNTIQLRDTSPGGYFNGGSGTIWDASTTADWASASGGSYNQAWSAFGGLATFEGTANTVNVNGSVAATAITFATDGYTLAPGTSGALVLGNGTITTGSGSDTIGVPLTGTGGVTKSGAGTLTLSGVNTYTGSTTISAGTLVLGAANSLPTSGTVTIGATGTAGTLDLAGNNQQVGGLAIGTGATAANQAIGSSSTANDATLTFNSAGSSSFGGIIQDVLGSGTKKLAMTVAGGTLTLSGANTYTGPTVINNAGTLTLSGSISSSSALTLGSGTLNSTITTGTQTFNNTTLNGFGTVTTVASGTVALQTITRNPGSILNISSSSGSTTAGNSVDATGILGTWATFGTGTSLKYAAGGSGSAISAYTGTAAATAANVTDTTGAVNYDVAAVGTLGAGASFNTLRYTGAAGTIAGNFTANGLMNAGSGALTSSGNVTIGANKELVIVGNTQGTTINGIIADNGSGPSSLTYGGPSAGALTLTNANTYSGGTTLTAGTIVFGSGSALGTGTITSSGGAIKEASTTGADLTTTNNLVVNGPTTLDGQTKNWTINANISGSGAISRGASGGVSIYLGGDDSGYTGTFTVQNNSSAVVRFTSTNAGSANASWVNNNGNIGKFTLDIAGNGSISFGSLTGPGQLQANAAGTKTLSVGALGLNDTYSGIIANGSGVVALTKIGSGSMTLSGVNTYTGPTTISAGMLTIGGAGQLNAGNYGGAITNNAVLNYNSSAAQTLSGQISGTGNLTDSGTGVLTLGGVQSSSQNIIAVNDGATLGESFIPSAQLTATTLKVGSSSGATLAFVPNSTTVARIAPGSLTWIGANNKINIAGGYNLVVGSSYPLIAATTMSGSAPTLNLLPNGVAGHLNTVGNTIYFVVDGLTNTVWTGAVNGMWDINTTANWTNTGTLGNKYIDGSPVQFDDTGLNTTTISNSTATTVSPMTVLVTNNTANYCFKANVVIAGAASLTKTGTANLTNSTANTYTGPTAINKGQLVVGVVTTANTSGALGINSAVSLANDSTAILNLNSFATQIGSLSGGGASGGNVTLGSAALTLGADNTSTSYGGIVSGTGGLTKIGTGTQTLSGANTFTGNWAVNAGTLNYNGSLSAGTQLSINNSGANSVVNIGSSANVAFNNANMLVGNNAAAAGALFQTGTVTGVGQLQLGVVTGGSYGYYNLSGSAALTIGELDCGGFNGAPTGVLDISGGTLTDTAWLIVARGSGGPSLLNLTGGTVNFTGTSANQLLMNYNGNATQSAVINVANASFNATNATSGILNMMRSGSAGQFAAVNLLPGGVMQVQGVNAGNTTGTSHFNFNGGKLKASTANTTFLTTGISTVNVYSGGGIVDNNGVNITIPSVLSAPAGSGLNGSVVVNSGGSGYIGAPAVTFSGDGTGATAYATVSGGAVTGVVITSPGVNYSSTPTIVFTGGGGSGAAATAPAPTANTSGAMTFTGAGTTTLTGGYYATGGINVLGGTLVMSTVNGVPSSVGSLVVSNATLALDATSGAPLPANNVVIRSTLNLNLNPYGNGINAAGNVTLGTNSTLNLNYGSVNPNPTAAAINLTGSVTKGTNIVINITASGLSVGSFPLITAGSAITTNNFKLGTLPPGIVAKLTNSTANSLDLLVTGAGQLLSWRGADGLNNLLTNWNINLSSNWYDLGNNLTKYLQYAGNTYGDNVTFGDNGYNTDGTNRVVLTNTVVPATVTFSSGTPYRLAGAGGIGGAAPLLLTNATAEFYLETVNTYTGGTTVGAGTLVITNDNALGSAAGPVSLTGGALQLNNNVASSRALSVNGSSSIGVVAGATAPWSGVLSGTGTLTKTGNGTLNFSANNTFSGATVVGAGTLNYSGTVTNTLLLVGNTSGAAASVNQTAGNVVINGGSGDCLDVGNIAGAFGYYNAAGGTLTANGIAVGGENNNGSGFSGPAGDGIMEINGATVNDIGWLVMARGTAAETGVLNMFSGSLTYAGGGLQCNWGSGQTSIINLMGGSVSSTNVPVNFRNANNIGIFNLNGGVLQPTAVTGAGVLNFNGGTLISAASFATPFLNLSGNAYVYSGGAKIDDNGQTLTISSALLAPTGYGVGSIALGGGGSGYIAPPIVTISGGNGSNATAIATVSGGVVTGITVTSPGNGYLAGDEAGMTVNFSGGGGTGASATVNPVTPNVSGGLIKLGAGTLTLSGANTYAGNTMVTNGELVLTPNYQAGGAVVVANSAKFGVLASSVTNSATIGALTMGSSGATTLHFAYGFAGNPTNASLSAGAVTLNGTCTIRIGGSFALGAFPVLKYTTLSGSFNSTVSAPRGMGASVSNDTVNKVIYVVVSSLSSPIVWSGTNSIAGKTNLWDLNTTTNWLFAGSPTTYQETVPPGDAVLFNDLGRGTVLLSNTASPASVTVSNSSVDYTFQGTGNISGTTSLTKQGSGTLTMSLTNTFSGGVTLNSGTLTYGNATALGSGTATLAGGTLKNGNFNLANNISVSGSTMFDMNGFNSTWSGNLSGPAALTVTNNGNAATLSLSGTNSGYGGTITFANNCAVDFKSADAGSASAAWVFNDSTAGRVRIDVGNGTLDFGSLAGSGQIVNNTASSTTILSVGALNTSTTFGGTIKDNGTGILALTKVGTGTLSVTGVNAYTGGTVIDAGTLAISSALTGSTATGALTDNDGGTLLVTVSGTGRLTPSVLTVGSSTGATLEFANVTSTTLAPLSPTNLVINGTATINVDSMANAALGTYPLVTNYTGGTVVLGALPPGVSAHLDTANNQISLVVDSISPVFWAVGNGSWDTTSFNWKTNGVASHYADGVPVIFDDTATGTGTILVTNTPSAVSPGSVTVNVTNKNYAIYGLAIAGSGALTKNGNGTLTLASSNTYSGGTTINGGKLNLAASEVLPDATTVTLGTSGTLELNAVSETIARLNINSATLTQTNGALTLTQGGDFGLRVGDTAGTTATYNLSGGSLTLINAGNANFGGAGTGTFNQTGGSVNTASWTVIGRNTGGTGLYDISAGTLTHNNTGTRIYVGENGTGTLNISGSAVVQTTGGVRVGNTGGTGTVNLNGGTLQTPIVEAGVTGASQSFYFNGGTLKAGGSSTTFIANMDTLQVRNGGAIIDDNGNAITIGQGIAHSSIVGDNATDGGLTKLGAGTLTLSGANTYTGNTTINAGTLQLNQSAPVLNANSTVSIASGAVLNLNNGAVTNIVNALKTNGVAVANGLYHAGVNLAPFLAGTGYIQVASVGPSGPGYITNSISGTTLTMTWPAGQGWRLVSQTNSLSTGLNTNAAAWSAVSGGIDGSNSVTINPAKPTVFYRLVNP